MGRNNASKRPGTWVKLRWPVVVLVLIVLSYLATVRACRSFTTAGRETVVAPMREAGNAAKEIAARFRSGTITTTFQAAIPRLATARGPKLEVASFEATETFRREDDRRTFFDLVPLGTTVTEIRVPVTYRYHLPLDDSWRLEVRGHTCVVNAPRLQPSLPPAIHTDRLEKHSTSGWLRFDADEQMEALERSITPLVSARAGNPLHLELVRESCRSRVAEFIRSWLLVEDHWREDRFSSVVVVFADEAAAVDQPPTLTLSDAHD